MGRKSRFWRRRRHDVFYVLALVLRWMAIVLPRGPGLWLFGVLGRLFCLLAPREHRKALTHLRFVYAGRWDERRIRRTARMVFVNLAKNLFDAVRLPRLPNRRLTRIVTVSGFDSLLACNRAGNGPVAVTLHLGCFEMLLPLTTRWGISGFAVGQRLYDRRLDAIVAQSRSGEHMEYVARDANPREVIRRLKRGMSFGVLIDQDTNVDGVFAHFLGKLAYTPSGAVRMALRHGIPLFVVSTHRVAGNRHRIDIQGPVELPSGSSEEENLVCSVEKINGLLSEAIERAPEQWVWMHRRWRRQPSDPRFAAVPSIERLQQSGSVPTEEDVDGRQ